MAICVDVTSEGFIYKTEKPLSECTSLVLNTTEEYNQNNLVIDPTSISSLFFFSFGLVLLSYKSSWVVGVVKQSINKF